MKKKWWMVFLLIGWAFSASAFPLNLGYMEIEIDKEAGIVKTIFEYNPNTLGYDQQAFHKTLGKKFWKSGNQNCQWRNAQTHLISPDQVRVQAQAFCPEIKSNLLLSLDFLSRINSSFKMIGRILNNGVESTFIADKAHRDIFIPADKVIKFKDFVSIGLGLQHPKAIDHILFLLAIVIIGGSFYESFKLWTGFAIGCVVSLSISAFGLFSIEPQISGPILALSLIYMALEGLLFKKNAYRFPVVAFFGLIFGFAMVGPLLDLNVPASKLFLALAGYGAGINLGQIVMLSVFIPIIYVIKKYSNYHFQISRFAAYSVMIVGSYWFVERSFLHLG